MPRPNSKLKRKHHPNYSSENSAAKELFQDTGEIFPGMEKYATKEEAKELDQKVQAASNAALKKNSKHPKSRMLEKHSDLSNEVNSSDQEGSGLNWTIGSAYDNSTAKKIPDTETIKINNHGVKKLKNDTEKHSLKNVLINLLKPVKSDKVQKRNLRTVSKVDSTSYSDGSSLNWAIGGVGESSGSQEEIAADLSETTVSASKKSIKDTRGHGEKTVWNKVQQPPRFDHVRFQGLSTMSKEDSVSSSEGSGLNWAISGADKSSGSPVRPEMGISKNYISNVEKSTEVTEGHERETVLKTIELPVKSDRVQLKKVPYHKDGLMGGGSLTIRAEEPYHCNKSLCPPLPEVCPRKGATCSVKHYEDRKGVFCNVTIICIESPTFEIDYEVDPPTTGAPDLGHVSNVKSLTITSQITPINGIVKESGEKADSNKEKDATTNSESDEIGGDIEDEQTNSITSSNPHQVYTKTTSLKTTSAEMSTSPNFMSSPSGKAMKSEETKNPEEKTMTYSKMDEIIKSNVNDEMYKESSSMETSSSSIDSSENYGNSSKVKSKTSMDSHEEDELSSEPLEEQSDDKIKDNSDDTGNSTISPVETPNWETSKKTTMSQMQSRSNNNKKGQRYENEDEERHDGDERTEKETMIDNTIGNGSTELTTVRLMDSSGSIEDTTEKDEEANTNVPSDDEEENKVVKEVSASIDQENSLEARNNTQGKVVEFNSTNDKFKSTSVTKYKKSMVKNIGEYIIGGSVEASMQSVSQGTRTCFNRRP